MFIYANKMYSVLWLLNGYFFPQYQTNPNVFSFQTSFIYSSFLLKFFALCVSLFYIIINTYIYINSVVAIFLNINTSHNLIIIICKLLGKWHRSLNNMEDFRRCTRILDETIVFLLMDRHFLKNHKCNITINATTTIAIVWNEFKAGRIAKRIKIKIG